MKYLILCVICINFIFSQENDSTDAIQFQEELNKNFSDSLSSPLLKEDLQQFKGLDFYPVTKKFIVEARFVKAKKEKAFKMKTTTKRAPKYKKYGTLYFNIDDKEFQLNVYQNLELTQKKGYEDYLFLPFTDTTNGKETYIGGRYLDFKIPKGSKVIINFNKAYNPYCAYNYNYSCPIVPMENDLNIAVEAGVKKFHD